MTRVTVFGANGFIGSAVAKRCQESGADCFCPERSDPALGESLGHVIYCAGVLTNHSDRVAETIEAHCLKPAALLEHSSFESFLYLSTAKVYQHGESGREDAVIDLSPPGLRDLYTMSKLAGESVCLSDPRSNVRVARISTVIGPNFGASTFVYEIIDSALQSGRIQLESDLGSRKDYVALDDVVDMVTEIAARGGHRVYNIGSGRQTTHAEIVDAIRSITNCKIEVKAGAARFSWPEIEIGRLRAEFSFVPKDPLRELRVLVAAKQKALGVTR